MSIKDFNENVFSLFLEKISKENKICFLMSDFSIHLLKTDSDHYFAHLILQPTRVTEKSKTLIDNIFFKIYELKTHSGDIVHIILDHLIQFVIFEDFLTPLPAQKINSFKKNFKDFSNERLKD